MSRHLEIKEKKTIANGKGHKMGNVVNCSPFNAGSKWTVVSTCKHCRQKLFVEKTKDDKVLAHGDALTKKCPTNLAELLESLDDVFMEFANEKQTSRAG
jgi:cytidine deaminase